VIPNYIFEKLPLIIRKLINNIEVLFWSKLNRINILKQSPIKGDAVIVFARNLSFKVDLEVNRLRSIGVRIVWATSHFHLSYENRKAVSLGDLVLIDNELAGNVNFGTETIVMPPVIKEKFKIIPPSDKISNIKRDCRIICCGTVHLYKNSFTGSVKHGSVFTMHPSRCNLLLADSNILVKNFSVIDDGVTLYSAQRDYMNTDLTSLYNMFRFAFIGSEASGIAAVGVYEAMACGCEVFIERNVGLVIGLKDGVTAWFFDGDFGSMNKRYQEVLASGEVLDSLSMQRIVQSRREIDLISSLKKELSLICI